MVRTKAYVYKSNKPAFPVRLDDPDQTDLAPTEPAPTELGPTDLAPTEPAPLVPALTEPAPLVPALPALPFTYDEIEELLEISGFEVSNLSGNGNLPEVECMYSKKDGSLSIIIDRNIHISIPAKEYFNKLLGD